MRRLIEWLLRWLPAPEAWELTAEIYAREAAAYAAEGLDLVSGGHQLEDWQRRLFLEGYRRAAYFSFEEGVRWGFYRRKTLTRPTKPLP